MGLLITYNSRSLCRARNTSSSELSGSAAPLTRFSKSPVHRRDHRDENAYRRLPSHPQGRGGVAAVENAFQDGPRLL